MQTHMIITLLIWKHTHCLPSKFSLMRHIWFFPPGINIYKYCKVFMRKMSFLMYAEVQWIEGPSHIVNERRQTQSVPIYAISNTMMYCNQKFWFAHLFFLVSWGMSYSHWGEKRWRRSTETKDVSKHFNLWKKLDLGHVSLSPLSCLVMLYLETAFSLKWLRHIWILQDVDIWEITGQLLFLQHCVFFLWIYYFKPSIVCLKLSHYFIYKPEQIIYLPYVSQTT